MRAVAVVAIAMLVAGCTHDGRELRAPAPGATAPPLVTTSTTVPGKTVAVTPIALASAAFDPGGAIPLEHTCDGAGVSPPLSWGAVPESTVELALTVTDPDAKGFVHWVIAGLSPTVQALATGVVPEDAVQATNDAGTIGWTGPCPPKGSEPHHYVFTLYALNAPSGVTAGMAGKEAIAAISNIPGLTATLIGNYQRA